MCIRDRFYVDAGNDRIGIGTGSPFAKFTIFGSGGQEARVAIEGESGADPYINFLANNTQHWSLGVDDSDSDKFKISKHSALGTNDYLTVDTSGDVSIGDGNLVLANTHGIDFSASESGSPNTSISSLLDDYEQGDWDPKDSSSGTTLSHNACTYVKVGNLVHVDFDITNDSGGALSNIYGLPFAVYHYASFRLAWVSAAGGGSQTSETNVQGGLISTSVNTLGLRVPGANATTTFANTVRIIGSGTYRTS